MLHALTFAGRLLADVLNFALGTPLMTLPRNFWSRKTKHQTARVVMSLVPLLLIGVIAWANHFMARVDAVPSRLPAHILGVPGAKVLAALHAGRSVAVAIMVQLIYLRDSFMHILGQMSAEVTVLLLGAILWVQLLVASTLLLGPVHVLMLNPMWQQRMKRFTPRVLEPLYQVWDHLWSKFADKRRVWFLGTDMERGEPMFVDIAKQRTTWIVGGAGRRSAALPLLSELRCAIQSGCSVLFIDTVDNAGLAEEMQAFAAEAGRAKDFQRLHITDETAEDFKLHADDIQRERRVVYMGLPMHQKSLALQEAAKRTLADLLELARQAQDEDPTALVVAIQDARELPHQAMARLSEETGLRLLIAQQTCDPDHLAQLVASLKARAKHVVLCLSVARNMEASNLAHALVHVSLRVRKEKSPQDKTTSPAAAVLSTQMIQALKSNEAHVMINGVLRANVVRLSAGVAVPVAKRNRANVEATV